MDFSNISNQSMNFTSEFTGGKIDLQSQFCNTLSSHTDIALLIISIGLIMQFARITFKNNEYLKNSGLPEGLIVLGFFYLLVVRFT